MILDIMMPVMVLRPQESLRASGHQSRHHAGQPWPKSTIGFREEPTTTRPSPSHSKQSPARLRSTNPPGGPLCGGALLALGKHPIPARRNGSVGQQCHSPGPVRCQAPGPAHGNPARPLPNLYLRPCLLTKRARPTMSYQCLSGLFGPKATQHPPNLPD